MIKQLSISDESLNVDKLTVSFFDDDYVIAMFFIRVHLFGMIVALSRVKSLEGLSLITALNSKQVKVSSEVEEFYKTLRIVK